MLCYENSLHNHFFSKDPSSSVLVRVQRGRIYKCAKRREIKDAVKDTRGVCRNKDVKLLIQKIYNIRAVKELYCQFQCSKILYWLEYDTAQEIGGASIPEDTKAAVDQQAVY